MIKTSIEPITTTIVLDVGGMKCAGCVRAVEKHITDRPGVKSACVNLLTGVAAIVTEPDLVTADTLAAKLTASGFPSQPRTSQTRSSVDRQAKYIKESQQLVRQLIIAGILLILSAIGHFTQPTTHLNHGDINPLNNFWWHWGLATLAIIFPGRSILVDGWRSMWHGNPNMNNLGWECFFEEPVMIIGFILLGRTLEQQAKHRAANGFDRLLSLQPAMARLVSTDPERPQAIEIPVEQVKVGEYLRVLPGEKIPADGAIRWGETTIDESLLTGESMPIVKQLGDLVIAGTVNQAGAISIEVTRTGDDTTLAQIIALVEAAQTRKAPVQQLADTVAGYFTYGTISIAMLTALFWYFIGIHSLNLDPTISTLTPLKTAVAVLVVACPCALGLATPTAILVGTGIGADRGLLIKGGDVLEAIHHLDMIVFDKTGTLTVGKPQVTDILTIDNISSIELLQLAAAAESVTNHPLATAIQQEATRLDLSLLTILTAHTELGLGVATEIVSATQTLVKVTVGNQRWLNLQGIEVDADWGDKADVLTSQGKTVVFVATDGAMMGLIAVTDKLREDAIETVQQLQAMGLEVVLLTGDRQMVADSIGSQLGITQIYAEVLPQDKAQIIEFLKTNSTTPRKVAMIGDGINDAPALAQADIGIALNAGTDIAIEVADLILMRDRLLDVVYAIELSQSTLTKIKQNLGWATIYNLIGIPAAAGLLYWCGWGTMLSPAAAGAMMALSSVSVVTNSLLLRWGIRIDRNL
jgi:P-type Cu2+ transporter